MKLYNSLGPNPHVVRMFAAEKGIALPLEEVDVMGAAHRQPPYATLNPMMQTPAFETDDGQVICEITAICEYLEELHPTPALIGATPGERAETRMWCRRIDLNIIEGRSRAFRATGAREFYKDKIKLLSVEAAQELFALVEDRVLWLDGQLAGKTYVCGDRYSLADIILYCFMTFGAPAGGSHVPPAARNLHALVERIRPRAATAA
ncbi:glutathione S-transferase family protein [Zavarzinia sp. CC-PAN008]|uniref:glutathione S-transferase family protein n=1 Tax=Zavarzinia sp. CC-PAN008 TaxID=3243332 RepID=UPI003F742175